MIEKQRINEAEKAVRVLQEEVYQHEWRLHYHVAPVANWMNDLMVLLF